MPVPTITLKTGLLGAMLMSIKYLSLSLLTQIDFKENDSSQTDKLSKNGLIERKIKVHKRLEFVFLNTN
jgi:hypothetical protein